MTTTARTTSPRGRSGGQPRASFQIPELKIAPFNAATPDAPPSAILQEWRDVDGDVIASGGRDGDQWWVYWQGLATFRFGASGDVRAEPLREGATRTLDDIFPRVVVPIVLLARGFEAFHASGVLSPRGAIVLCGRSGTGKSTTALALAGAGFGHLADDAVVYRIVNGHPVVTPLPFPVRVSAAGRTAAGLDAAPAMRRSLRHLTAAGPAVPFHRIYQLRRDERIDPARPCFTLLRDADRFESVLTYGRSFDMDGEHRRRTLVEALMTVARTVDVWECRFAPSLPALPQLAAAIRAHALSE